MGCVHDLLMVMSKREDFLHWGLMQELQPYHSPLVLRAVLSMLISWGTTLGGANCTTEKVQDQPQSLHHAKALPLQPGLLQRLRYLSKLNMHHL